LCGIYMIFDLLHKLQATYLKNKFEPLRHWDTEFFQPFPASSCLSG
jgi:hypothetical protein